MQIGHHPGRAKPEPALIRLTYVTDGEMEVQN